MPEWHEIPVIDGTLRLMKGAYPFFECHEIFNQLYRQLDWKKDHLHLMGKKVEIPRLQVWIGDEGTKYTYSGLEMHPKPWSKPLENIKSQVETWCQTSFNSVLCNLYRDGSDCVGWHADDEPELGKNPTIASLSFGASRKFSLKHQEGQKVDLLLENGDLLLMSGQLQEYWKHSLPRTKKVRSPRINLTFRQISP